ncbi:hypothetical protein MTF65_18800 [Streptomyces sp. APSN-46.1]|uniref:hypothetical protein n=1 Tax=Streptomyces sp. APSN-46.1 TaxID=2929049 RepID=UPI001FB34A7B|nr:hypothetical protein [Streptomyces sp. APSN-46.1]MCJ1679354.1 hypothetical protein [Streptomyces sp. APSN-46.1]
MIANANKQFVATHERAHAAWVRKGRPEGRQPELLRVPAGTFMHDLRHFYASLLIKHRENLKTVQKRLGLAKPSITLDTYTHAPVAGRRGHNAGSRRGGPRRCAPVVPCQARLEAFLQVRGPDQR